MKGDSAVGDVQGIGSRQGEMFGSQFVLVNQTSIHFIPLSYPVETNGLLCTILL